MKKINIIIYSILIIVILILVFLLYQELKTNSLLYEELKLYKEEKRNNGYNINGSINDVNDNKEAFDYDYFDLESTENEIWNAYYNNLLEGTKKYTGKRIKSKVNFVDFTTSYDYKGDINLIINFNKSYCDTYLKEQNIDLTKISKGQEITIIGSINTYLNSGQKIKFEKCKIII